MTCFFVRGHSIRPNTQLHRSVQVASTLWKELASNRPKRFGHVRGVGVDEVLGFIEAPQISLQDASGIAFLKHGIAR